jgi:SnoaL-like domain
VISADILQGFCDKQLIQENLMRYARAADRYDATLMKTTRWPDATENDGRFDGTGEEWSEYAESWKDSLGNSNHHISNVLIEIEGPRAKCESMFLCVAQTKSGISIFVAGSYRDLCEKRGDEWRILRRDVVYDWCDSRYLSNRWDLLNMPEMSNWGTFFPDDPIYADWAHGKVSKMPEHLKSRDLDAQ